MLRLTVRPSLRFRIGHTRPTTLYVSGVRCMLDSPPVVLHYKRYSVSERGGDGPTTPLSASEWYGTHQPHFTLNYAKTHIVSEWMAMHPRHVILPYLKHTVHDWSRMHPPPHSIFQETQCTVSEQKGIHIGMHPHPHYKRYIVSVWREIHPLQFVLHCTMHLHSDSHTTTSVYIIMVSEWRGIHLPSP